MWPLSQWENQVSLKRNPVLPNPRLLDVLLLSDTFSVRVIHLELIQTKFWENINLPFSPSWSYATQNCEEAFSLNNIFCAFFCFLIYLALPHSFKDCLSLYPLKNTCICSNFSWFNDSENILEHMYPDLWQGIKIPRDRIACPMGIHL